MCGTILMSNICWHLEESGAHYGVPLVALMEFVQGFFGQQKYSMKDEDSQRFRCKDMLKNFSA